MCVVGVVHVPPPNLLWGAIPHPIATQFQALAIAAVQSVLGSTVFVCLASCVRVVSVAIGTHPTPLVNGTHPTPLMVGN